MLGDRVMERRRMGGRRRIRPPLHDDKLADVHTY